jgi:hypothetical protein
MIEKDLSALPCHSLVLVAFAARNGPPDHFVSFADRASQAHQLTVRQTMIAF